MKVPFVVQILRWFNLTLNSAHTFAFSCQVSLAEDASLASCSHSSNRQVIFREYSPLYSRYKLVSDCVNIWGRICKCSLHLVNA